MSTNKKYTCSLCNCGTTKSNYESYGCCAKCKEKMEKNKKDGKVCAICKQSSTEKFIRFTGLCVNCNNKRCGLDVEDNNVKKESEHIDIKEEEGHQENDSDIELKTNIKKYVVDQLISNIVQSYAELGLDNAITKQGFVLNLKVTLNDILENELNN